MQSIIENNITQHTASTGLTAPEILSRREQYGENRLPVEKSTPAWAILLNQVKSPLVYIILVAALVSLAAKEYSDFAIILAVVVIDVILGFVQEYQAQKTYTALKGLLKPTTTVLRDGERKEVEIWELVPGDLVLINAGEKVSGDGSAAIPHPGLEGHARSRPLDFPGMAGSGWYRPRAAGGGRGRQVDQQQDPWQRLKTTY